MVETAMQNKMREALEEQRVTAESLLAQTIIDVSHLVLSLMMKSVANPKL